MSTQRKAPPQSIPERKLEDRILTLIRYPLLPLPMDAMLAVENDAIYRRRLNPLLIRWEMIEYDFRWPVPLQTASAPSRTGGEG